MFARTAVLSLAACAGIVTQAAGQEDRGIREFNTGYRTWNEGSFYDAAESFRKAAEADPSKPALRRWQGLAHFHRMLYYRHLPGGKTDAGVAGSEAARAITALEAAVAADPTDAEGHALLGTLYGIKVQGGLIDKMRFGPKIDGHLKAALRRGSDNPRVQYLLGAGLFNTAGSQDGYRKALDSLRKAEALFAKESGGARNGPTWGEPSCQTFLGRTLEKLGRTEEAADAYAKAVALQPADQIAADGLARLRGKPATRP